uniref:hypothetical protein n=1 Tax=Aliarcobacter sp. TaxID=2321116 RepID=UPI00404886A8
MEYYNLKLEYRNNYKDSFYVDSLSFIVADYYKCDNSKALKIIKNSISKTNTPIEFLKTIKKNIQ